jgi:uncharacterized protein
MENHAKYGDTIFFHDDKSLFLNLFIPSELSWPEKGLTIRQETKFPESDTTQLRVKAEKPVALSLMVRWPAWSEKLSVRVNGKAQKITGAPGSYVAINRTWQNGDRVDVQLRMALHTEPLPGTTNIVAVLYGPVVLAGDLGTNGMPTPYARNQTDQVRVPDPAVPVFVGDTATILKKIKAAKAPLEFQTKNLGKPNDVTLIPFFRANHERYSVYWNIVSSEDARKNSAELSSAMEIAMKKALDAENMQ